MKDRIYLMFNRLSNRFSEPFGCATDAVAKRHVRNAFSKSGISLNDFDCYCVADYDLLTGEVTVFPKVRIDITQSDTISDVERTMEVSHEQRT